MRRYKREQHIKATVKTIVSCVGWGLLGYLVMVRVEGLFWPGWFVMTAALCVGSSAADKLITAI